jgi:N-acyl-D-amino-acid deacylase
MRCDILIQGGTVFDGSGSPGVLADVAIHQGRLMAIGNHLGVTAQRVIDARGLVVAPGFIDIKTHSDFTLPIKPKANCAKA